MGGTAAGRLAGAVRIALERVDDQDPANDDELYGLDGYDYWRLRYALEAYDEEQRAE